MIIEIKDINVKTLDYTIRLARIEDAAKLSELRLQIDGETENMNREQGEGYMDSRGFEELIKSDTESTKNIFLVTEIKNRIVAYSRCEGSELKRFSHKVEFGVGVLKEFWGFGIGTNMLKESINWADSIGIKKIVLSGVVEKNTRAVEIYKKLGFEIESILKNDRIHSDGNYYNSLIMARFKD